MAMSAIDSSCVGSLHFASEKVRQRLAFHQLHKARGSVRRAAGERARQPVVSQFRPAAVSASRKYFTNQRVISTVERMRFGTLRQPCPSSGKRTYSTGIPRCLRLLTCRWTKFDRTAGQARIPDGHRRMFDVPGVQSQRGGSEIALASPESRPSVFARRRRG